jgi:hypothetical protein
MIIFVIKTMIEIKKIMTLYTTDYINTHRSLKSRKFFPAEYKSIDRLNYW